MPAAITSTNPRFHTLREPMGRLDLHVAQRQDRSVAIKQFHQGALRVMRPHYLDVSGQVCYTIINPGGAYFGGDDYHLSVRVDEGASLLLTGQSATKVYKTPGNYALQDFEITLGPGAVLEYVPDQLIAYEGATFSQHMRVNMDSTASLFSAEIITPGWSPTGRPFTYDEVRVRTSVSVDGELTVIDNLLARPGTGELTADTLLFLEDQTHVATVLAMDQGIDGEFLDDLREHLDSVTFSTPVRHGATLTPGHGLAVRAIGTYTEDLYLLVSTVANFLRARLRNQGPLHLRKY